MATINATFTRGMVNDDSVVMVSWTPLTEADTATPVEMTEYADRCVQVGGTFNGGTVVIEGSNDGVTYFTLNDVQASAISKTAAALEQIAEVPRYTRPRVSAGTGVSLTIMLLLRRSNPMRS